MHVKTLNPAGLDEWGQQAARDSGLWYVVQELHEGPLDEAPVYHASPVTGQAEAERLVLGFSELFPERRVAAAVFRPGGGDEWPLIDLYGPDGHDVSDLGEQGVEPIVTELRRAHAKATGTATRARDAAAGKPPAAQGEPAGHFDPTADHLYANKKAFPDALANAGTAAEDDRPDVAKAAELAGFKVTPMADAEGRRVGFELDPGLYKPDADAPPAGGGEGGAP